jgi:hypothetical protein
MLNSLSASTALESALRAPRVLVFSADDTLFSLHLDWVESVYDRDTTTVYSVRDRSGQWHSFLIHDQEPAMVVDPRELFGLREILGEPDRSSYVLVRSGGYLLALQVDACVGVQELNLRRLHPVPTNLVRDNGICVGHLVDLDGTVLTVLDPAQLLDSHMTTRLDPGVAQARAFVERQRQIEALWPEICRDPSAAALRSYARLCRRNGRSRAASAARLVLKHWSETDAPTANSRSHAESVVADLLRCARQARSGEIVVEGAEGERGRVALFEGRIIDATAGEAWGRRALRELLMLKAGECRFVESDTSSHPQRMDESTAALLIEALESLHDDRRGKRGR